MTRTLKALYVHGDGMVWKLNKAAMQQVANGTPWLDAAKATSTRLNHRSGRWSNLPKALYQLDGESHSLDCCAVAYELISYDYEAEIIATCKEATR